MNRPAKEFAVMEHTGGMSPIWNICTSEGGEITEAECERFLACYKACEGMEDPKRIIGGLVQVARIHNVCGYSKDVDPYAGDQP